MAWGNSLQCNRGVAKISEKRRRREKKIGWEERMREAITYPTLSELIDEIKIIFCK